MKLNRFFINLVLILCVVCFSSPVLAANPAQPGSQPGQVNVPKKVTVQAAQIQKSDLVIISANFSHAPKAGETLGSDSILNIRIKNQGPLQSPQNTVKVTCTPLSGKPCPEGLSGTLSCGPLAPNQATTLPWPNSGGSWFAGSYKLTIEADSGKTVAELNEDNNTITFITTILANTASAPSAQSAGNQQYAGSATDSTPLANASPGQASTAKKKQIQNIQNSQNTMPSPSAASTPDMTLLPLSITSPNDGAAFYVGKKYTITWNDLQKMAQKVKITLLSKTSNAVVNIAKDVPNTGSYEWTVAQGESNYALKIEGMGQGSNYSDSKDISIIRPMIKIINPQSGATWNKSVPVSHTITWQKSNMPESAFGSQVRVKLGCNWSMGPYGGYQVDFFTTETSNDGEYVFTTLQNIADGNIRFGQNGCFVKVESIDGSVSDKVKISVIK